MAQLQWMETDFNGFLDNLTDEMCQMNTRVSCNALWQTPMDGFPPSPSPSPEATTDKGDDADDKVLIYNKFALALIPRQI